MFGLPFRKCLAAICFLCVSAAVAQDAGQAGAKVVTITVTGAGMDEEEALRDAMRKAVEQGAGTFIYSHSQTKDYALVRDTVLARAAGFIQNRTVLSKREMEDGTWEVRIKAEVSVRGIQDAWGAVTTMLQQIGRPKIMVFINEKIDGRAEQDSTVQTRIENLLLASGFLLVNREQLKEIDKKDLEAAVAEDNPAKVQAVAKRFGAQLFISGSANAAAGPQRVVSGVQLFPYQADANIKCYRSDTAQLLSSIPGEPTRGVDRVGRSAAKKSLDEQAKRIAPRVRFDILRFWQDALSGTGEVQLHVELITFRQSMDLKKVLEQFKNVKAVNRRFSNNVAEYSLQSDVTAEVLAEKIAEAITNLEITDVSQNVIKAKFKGSE